MSRVYRPRRLRVRLEARARVSIGRRGVERAVRAARTGHRSPVEKKLLGRFRERGANGESFAGCA